MAVLYDDWLTDLRIGFAANWLIADPVAQDTPVDLYFTAGSFIGRTNPSLDGISLPTLSLLAALPADRAKYQDRFGAFDISNHLDCARRLVETLSGEHAPSIVLAANAAIILQREHVSFETFLKWAARASPRISQNHHWAVGWNRTIWVRILNALKAAGSLAAADAKLEELRSAKTRLAARLSALNELHELVSTAADLKVDQPITQTWVRFAKDLMSRQFCWPLMITRTGGAYSGISLPISTFLSPDGKSKIYFKDGKRRNRRFEEQNADATYGFERGPLRWKGNWYVAFETGLDAAKVLWRTQNGRLADAEERREKLESSLVVDLGHAQAVVEDLYVQARNAGHFTLEGRSAEAYVTQIALGLLLPEGARPEGVATGMVSPDGGAYTLRPVFGIEEKLRYANSSGQFSRIVLPDDRSIKNTSGEELERLQQARMVEVNYCTSARSAADAMQVSGWRRAHFFRTPAVQRSFYGFLYALFEHEKARNPASAAAYAHDYLSDEDREKEETPALSDADISRLEKLTAYLTSQEYAVKYCRRSDVGLSEELLGKWLAWIDHRVRGGYAGEPGPGLGVVCLRTSERDNEIRLWSAVFELLKASLTQWQTFQWADLRPAAETLAQLLNNFKADPAISALPAPDLLVILDDAGYTQPTVGEDGRVERPTNRIFPDDFRGQMFDLLNPFKSNRRSYLADALKPLDASRMALLNKTRIIIIYDDAAKEDLEDAPAQTLDVGLRRLSIFRSGFTVQSAVAVLDHDRPPLETREGVSKRWKEVRVQLDTWCARQRLFRHRGHYHMNLRLRRALRGCAEHDDPQLRFAAARSLVPLIYPRRAFLASNRDRALEPESVAEALWHLQEARQLTKPKDQAFRSKIQQAIATVTLLRSDPDWDTVRLLQLMKRHDEGYELALELLEQERAHGRVPHSSRYAFAINAIGRYAKDCKADHDKQMRLIEEARSYFKVADPIAEKSRSLQQRLKLCSEYAFCLRSNLQGADPLVRAELSDLESGMESYLEALLGQGVLGDMEAALSRDWLAAKWDDRDLTSSARSKFVQYACELYREDWDIPWVARAALVPLDNDPLELEAFLLRWASIFRGGSAGAFFERIRGLRPKRGQDIFVLAALNLLHYLARDWHTSASAGPIAETWLEHLSAAIAPYREMHEDDKPKRNSAIWQLCELLEGTNALNAKQRALAERLLDALGPQHGWLFVLANHVDVESPRGLQRLLRFVADDSLQQVRANAKYGNFVALAKRKLSYVLKRRWAPLDHQRIENVRRGLR